MPDKDVYSDLAYPLRVLMMVRKTVESDLTVKEKSKMNQAGFCLEALVERRNRGKFLGKL